MGSDLFSNYTVEKTPFLQGGYMKLWKIFHGTHKVRKQEVCVFVFEKKSLERFPKSEHNEILLTLKCEAHMLVKFKHPSLLSVVEPFVEDKNSLGFVTERFDYSLNSWISMTKPSKLEIKQMVIELAKAILFLHNDAHVVHNNLNPDNIFIDLNNKIKISGMSFSIEDPPLQGGDIDISKYSPNAIQNINPQNNPLSLPDLSFIAPELIFNNKSFYSCDMFSLGLILYQILKDHLGESKNHLFMKLSNNSISAYKKFFSSYDSYLSSKLKFENDDNFLLSKLLQKEQSARPRVREIIDTPWFNDPKLKALNFIMNLESNDQKKNIEFLEKLPKIIGMFENKIIVKRFLPALLKAIKVETLINPCLPAIFSICESPSFNISFAKEVWPKLRDLFKLRSLPAAAIYFLISKVQYIGDNISNSEFSSNFLNLICKAMDCNVAKIQTVVAENLQYITKKIDSLAFKNQIYPRILQVISNTNSRPLKIDFLKKIKELYTKLDQNIINESLLNNLEKIRKADNNNEICMTIAEIYEEIAKIVNIEGIANKILPNLISILVGANITKTNFNTIMKLVQTYLERIRKTRFNDLADDAGSIGNTIMNNNNNNNNQSQEDNFMDSLLNQGNNNNKGNDKDDFLSSFFDNSQTNNNNNNNNNGINFTTSSNQNKTTTSANNDFNFTTSSSNNNNTKSLFDGLSTNTQSPYVKSNVTSNIKTNSSNYNFNLTNSSTNKTTTTNDIFSNLTLNKSNNNPSSLNSNLNNINLNFNNNSNNNNNKNHDSMLNNLMNDLPTYSNTNTNANTNQNNNNNLGGFSMNVSSNTNTQSSGFDPNNLDFLSGNKHVSNSNNNNTNFNFGGMGIGNNNNNFNFSNNNNTFNFLNNNTSSNNTFGGMNNNNNNNNNLFANLTTLGNNNNNNNNNKNNNNNFFNF